MEHIKGVSLELVSWNREHEYIKARYLTGGSKLKHEHITKCTWIKNQNTPCPKKKKKKKSKSKYSH